MDKLYQSSKYNAISYDSQENQCTLHSLNTANKAFSDENLPVMLENTRYATYLKLTVPTESICDRYEKEGYCKAGDFVTEFRNRAGESNDWPEKKCCICGKKTFDPEFAEQPINDSN